MRGRMQSRRDNAAPVCQYFVPTSPISQIRSTEVLTIRKRNGRSRVVRHDVAPERVFGSRFVRVFGAGEGRDCSATRVVVRGKEKRAGARV